MDKLFLSLGVFLIAAPLFLLAGAAITPAHTLLWLPPLAAAVLLALCARLLPGRKRVAGTLAAMALSAAAALLIGSWLDAGPIALAPAAVSAAVAAAHARLLAQPRGGVPPALWYVGLVGYMAVRVVGAMGRLTELTGPLRVFLLLYAVYLMFYLSLQSLEDGAGTGRGPSRAMKLRNAAAAALMALLLLALTHLPALRRAFGEAVRGLVAAAFRLAEWLASLFARQSMGGGGGDGADLSELAGEAQEPSILWIILEKAAYVVTAAVALAAAFFALRAVFRALRRLMIKLAARWRAYIGALTDAYDDTVESLVDWGEVRRMLSPRREKAAKKEKERPWQALSPRQKVRRSFRDYLRRHPDLPGSSTARQALGGGALSRLYEEARYSSREITPEEAEESAKMRDRI